MSKLKDKLLQAEVQNKMLENKVLFMQKMVDKYESLRQVEK
jgi:hypothetical protein